MLSKKNTVEEMQLCCFEVGLSFLRVIRRCIEIYGPASKKSTSEREVL